MQNKQKQPHNKDRQKPQTNSEKTKAPFPPLSVDQKF
jgi:hypothetical protein